MSMDPVGSASEGSKAQEDYEEVYIYEAEPEGPAKQQPAKAKKKAAPAPDKLRMQRMMKFVMSGRKPQKSEVTPIYEYNEEHKREAFYFVDDKEAEKERIYEVKKGKQTKPSLVYRKGKETYNETSIPGKEAQKVGPYSTRNQDYPIDEDPYGEVLLEETVTEGKPRPDLQQANKHGNEGAGERNPEQSHPKKDSRGNVAGQTARQVKETGFPKNLPPQKGNQASEAIASKKEKKKQDTVIEEIIWDD